MNATQLKNEFIKWLIKKTGEEFSITNLFLLACLDEEIDTTLNSTFNGIPFYDHFSSEELMIQILNGWLSTAKSFLRLPESNVSISFRGIKVPKNEKREELLSQISRLASKQI
ncbi:MAG TPA: hypothetical protein VIJ75_16025 [Hanamia sp.]